MAIQIFRKGDKLPELPRGIADIHTEHLVSRFGFKIVDIDGALFWEAGTEADFRKAEAERLGIKPEQVTVLTSCYQTGPRSCAGFCDSGFCTLMYQPSGNYYYCGCS